MKSKEEKVESFNVELDKVEGSESEKVVKLPIDSEIITTNKLEFINPKKDDKTTHHVGRLVIIAD